MTKFPLFRSGLVCNFANGVSKGQINKELVNNEMNSGKYVNGTECADLVREKYPNANGVQWHRSGVCWAAFQQTSIDSFNKYGSGYWQSCLFEG